MFIQTSLKKIAGTTGVALCLAALTSTALASLTAYEPFNYTTSIPNGTASTATGFTGNWTCGTTPSVVAGMTYTALPTANNSVSSTSGRQSVALASRFLLARSGSAFCSANLEITAETFADFTFPTAARVCISVLVWLRFPARKAD